LLITFPTSRTLFIGFSPEWGGTTRLGYTDVLVVREIDGGSWLAREYMPAHQHCGLFSLLGWGFEGSPLIKGRPLVLQSGTDSLVLSGQSGVYHPLSPVISLGLRNQRKKERNRSRPKGVVVRRGPGIAFHIGRRVRDGHLEGPIGLKNK